LTIDDESRIKIAVIGRRLKREVGNPRIRQRRIYVLAGNGAQARSKA
jgi:hypothetical protein